MCENNINGNCLISSVLAGINVPVAKDSCKACLLSNNPKQINNVTCSKAVYTLKMANKPIPEDILFCAVNPNIDGPGTRIHNYILRMTRLLKVQIPQTCNCHSWINEINQWGYSLAIQNISTITNILYDSLLTTNSYLSYIGKLFPKTTKFVIQYKVLKLLK